MTDQQPLDLSVADEAITKAHVDRVRASVPGPAGGSRPEPSRDEPERPPRVELVVSVPVHVADELDHDAGDMELVEYVGLLLAGFAGEGRRMRESVRRAA